MAVLSLNRLNLPRGFRFKPTEEELIDHLKLKIAGKDEQVSFITEVQFCKNEPWDLPNLSGIETKDLEWFFFSPLDLKHQKGNRSNRATNAGYWKVTGKERKIKSAAGLIGMKKTLVFYKGRTPTGKRTSWVMHEYRTTLKELDGMNPGENAFVACRLFYKQKKSIKGKNFDEAGPPVSVPATSKSHPEEFTISKLSLPSVSPASAVQAENNQTSNECSHAEYSDEMISKATEQEEGLNIFDLSPEPLDRDLFSLLPSQHQEELASCCNDLNKGHSGLHPPYCTNEPANTSEYSDEMISKAIELEEGLNIFDLSPEPLDRNLFSLLPSQHQEELASCCNDLNKGHSGVHSPYCTNEPANTSDSDSILDDFVNSILNDQDEYSHNDLGYGMDNGSCSGLHALVSGNSQVWS